MLQSTSSLSSEYWFEVNPNLPDMSSGRRKRRRIDLFREKDALQSSEQTVVDSKKSYETMPTFEKGLVHSDKHIKILARVAYAKEENVFELEDSDNDVPDEFVPGATRRRIKETPEDDYPVPIGGGDMSRDPWDNVYVGAISSQVTEETPQEHLQARMRTIWKLEIARMKERHAEMLKIRPGDDEDKPTPVDKQSPEAKGVKRVHFRLVIKK